MSKNNIGENIRKYRMMAGFTQAELAEKLSEVEGKTIAASAVAGYENGQRTPKVEIRVQMARILGVDPVGLSGIELDESDEKRLRFLKRRRTGRFFRIRNYKEICR